MDMSRRERYVLTQWTVMRDHGMLAAVRRRVALLLFWIVCFLPGLIVATPYRSYIAGALLGFIAHNLMTLRATCAFWPVMREFIDWPKVDQRVGVARM